MIRAEREPRGRGVDGWLEGAPDVAVEVKGDDASVSELLRKALEYLAAGARLVWIVDPDAEQVVALTPPDHTRVLGRDETLDGGDVLPGFACSVADLFA
jgi:Uma2 family endonuclease